MKLISKIITLLIFCISIAFAYMGSYGDDIVTEFNASQNSNGVILKSTGKQYKWVGMGVNTSIEEIEGAPILEQITLYLGKSYDTWSPVYGKGTWEQNNGGFLVFFENETFAFGRQELFIEANSESTEDAKQAAWLVIAAGSKDSTIAAKKFNDLDLKLPSYNFGKELFPKLMHSDSVQGLNKGFWIVVAALTKHKKVAQEYALYLQNTIKDGYCKKIPFINPPDVRAVWLKEIKVWRHDGNGIVENSPAIVTISHDAFKTPEIGQIFKSNEGYFTLYQYQKKMENTLLNFDAFEMGMGGGTCHFRWRLKLPVDVVYKNQKVRVQDDPDCTWN